MRIVLRKSTDRRKIIGNLRKITGKQQKKIIANLYKLPISDSKSGAKKRNDCNICAVQWKIQENGKQTVEKNCGKIDKARNEQNN